MKRLLLHLMICLFLLIFAVLSGCTAEKEYSLKDAKRDGCVVYENGDITSGEDVWQNFLSDISSGKSASVQLGYYFTLSDPSQCDPELYEEIMNDYPVLYIMTLTYDGSMYTLEYTVDGENGTQQFSYLAHYIGKPRSSSATFTDYEYYVLVNDSSVTWQQIEDGMFSSQSGAGIPHHVVYSDLIFNN